MSIESIRLSESSKRQLISLKRRTGIGQWNILCRWAFCLSLSENRQTGTPSPGANSNIEMTWRTFAGRHAEIYQAIVRSSIKSPQYCGTSELEFVVGHIERGISRLSNMKEAGSIAGLLEIAASGSDLEAA